MFFLQEYRAYLIKFVMVYFST